MSHLYTKATFIQDAMEMTSDKKDTNHEIGWAIQYDMYVLDPENSDLVSTTIALCIGQSTLVQPVDDIATVLERWRTHKLPKGGNDA